MKIASVAGRLYDAYNRHDPAAVAMLYTADATHEDIAQGRPKTGPDEIAAGLVKFFGWFPDAHWEPQSGILGADGREAATYLLTATLQAQMGPVAPRGQRISLRGVHVLDLRDGLIMRSEDYWDAASFQRQLNNG
jgi:steroid delta-isomerase-like uncharacterized protein